MRLTFSTCVGIGILAVGIATARAEPLNTTLIEQITGRPGILDPKNGVFKISIPRDNIKVFVGQWPLSPFLGLTSWASFRAGKNGNALIAGDLVLFQDEVNPAISAALTNGLSVTALDSRFLYDEPKVYNMHITGHGDLEQLALGLSRVLNAVRETRIAHPYLAVTFGGLPPPDKNAITGQIIENILGVKGRASVGRFKVVIGRTVTVSGHKIGEDMGVDSWAVFAGVDDDAVMEGDLAVPENELQAVLKILCQGSINITAINNHLAGETPRLLFVSYWGKDDIKSLAQTLKAALDVEGK